MRFKTPSKKNWKRAGLALALLAALCLLIGMLLRIIQPAFELLIEIPRPPDLNEKIAGIAIYQINKRLYGKLTIGSFKGGLLEQTIITDLVLTDDQGKEVLRIDRLEIEGLRNRKRGQKALFVINVQNMWVRVEKTEQGWNTSRIHRKKPPIGEPRVLPRLRGALNIIHLVLEFSPEPGREHRLYAPETRLDLETADNQVEFLLEIARGSLAPPSVALERALAEGMAKSTGTGWELSLKSGEVLTSDAIAILDGGHYYTYDKTLSASLERFEVGLDTLAALWPEHPLIAPLAGKGGLQGDTQFLSFNASLELAAGALSATGTYDLPAGRIRAGGDMKGFSPSKLIEVNFPLSGLNGGFNLDYRPARKEGEPSHARPAERRINAVIHLDSFFHPQYHSIPLKAQIEMIGDNYTASADSRELDRGLSMSARGANRHPYPVSARLEFHNLDPARFKEGWPQARLAGILTLEGRGRNFEEFAGRGALTLDDSELYHARVQTVNLGYELARGRLATTRGEAVIEDIHVIASGFIELLKKSLPFSFDLDLDISNPKTMAALSKNALEAERGAARLKLSGTKDAWRAEGRGELFGVEAAGIVAERADAVVDLAGKSGDRIAGELRLDLQNSTLKDQKSFELPLFNLELLALLPESPARTPRLNFSLTADSEEDPDYGLDSRGSLALGEKGAFNLDLETLDLRLIGEDWRLSLPVRIESEKGRFLISFFQMQSRDQSLALSGEISRETLNMMFLMSGFELEPWMARLRPGDSIEGALTGSLALVGTQAEPELDGQFSMTGLRMNTARLEEVEGSLRQRGERLNFSVRALSRQAGDIRSWGELPVDLSFLPFRVGIRRDQELEAKIRVADMEAGLFEPFLPWLRRLAGNVSITADLAGTLDQPLWNGWSRLDNLQFEVPAWGLRLSGVSGRADLDDNLVRIPELAVFSGGGEARLAGEVLLKGFGIDDFNLNLTARNFRAMNTPDTRASLDADLGLRGNLDFPRIRGEVKFTDLVYRPPLLLAYQGMAWESEDPTIQVKGEEIKAESSSLLDRAELSLKVGIPDTGTLRNQELNIRFGGDLEVKKFPGSFFLIFGEVESRSGWINFQGKPFQIERGVFVFPAIPVIDPDLDLLASYRAPGYMTYIKITGTLSQPALEIYSEPPLDPADVLAVVLFGRPVSELGQGERDSLARTGGQLAAGYAAAELASSLGTALNLDAIVISAGETAEESGIGVGKYISDKLYVFYYHQFSDEAAEEFRVRYDVTKRLSIEASQDVQGQGGVDAYYTFTY